MSNLGPQFQNLSYAGLLQVPGGITASLQQVQDGDGNNTGLYLSSTGVSIAGFTATTTQNISGGAAGSLPYQSAINTTAFIPAGTNGYVLTSNGAAAPSWSATAPNALTSTTATNIAGGSTGFLPYQTAAGLTGFIGTGAIGQVLTSTGAGAAPVWSASSTIATALAGGSAGQLPYQSAAGVTSFLAAGSAGQLLRSNGAAAPSWVTLNAVSVGALAIDGTNAMTAALNAGNYKVVNLATPTLATDAATKSYVDSVATGLNIKAACAAATTTNITLSGAQSVDGVPVGLGERVLVKNQTAQEENGIYVSAAGAWTRATDADTWSELVGATVFIEYGSVNDLTTWVSNVIAGGTLGVTPVVFVQFAATQSYTAGAGLSLVGNEFSLSSPVSVSNGGTGVSSLSGVLFGNAGSAVTTATGAQIASGIGITPVLNASFAGTCSGNAQTATALQTARTINGVSFNGTSNITVTADTTNSLTFNNSGLGSVSGVTFNGSLPQTISYNTIGAPSLTGVGATGTWPISVSGTSGGLSAASGVTPGTYSYATVTVNDKGLVTYAASNGVTSGTVTSVGLSAPTGFVVSGSPVTSSGTLTLGFAAGYSLPTNSAQIDWNTAYSQRFQWDGGGTNLNATTGRASLGLGNVALINTNGSTSNYLRGDGNWVTPTSSATYVVVSGFTTAAINTAIATAGSGGTIFLPAGTYSITSTITLNDINVIGSGYSTILQGSTASLGSANPMFIMTGIVTLKSFQARFDSKPGSASSGQYVIFRTGDGYNPLQRYSNIDSIWANNCGTAFYNPTGGGSVFSTTFSNLRIESFTYRGFDFRGTDRTGNIYSNIYLSNIISAGNRYTCNCLFALSGQESECVIDQLNIEHSFFTQAAVIFDGASAIACSALHIEQATPSSNNIPYIYTNSSSGTFNSLVFLGNWYPAYSMPTTTGNVIFQCNSSNNTYGSPVATANYFNIGEFYIANSVTTLGWNMFARGTNDGPMYVEIGGYQYTPNDNYYANFPTSGNIEFISTGVNSYFNNPIRKFNGLTTFKNDGLNTVNSGATTTFERPTNGSLMQMYIGGVASGQLYTSSGGTPVLLSGSDYRLKENIEPIADACARMKFIQAYTYNMIGFDDVHEGFLAHELQQVCGNAVLGEKDAVDEDGNPVYQQVGPALLIPLMSQAVKEILVRLDALESKINSMQQ